MLNRIARTSYEEMHKVARACEESRKLSDADERMIATFTAEQARDEHALITVVFAAFALEAHIYDYAARRLSKSFVDQYLDKLDTAAKWVLVPQLITGNAIDRGGQPFEYLRRLIKDRNEIVHSKSRNINPGDLAPEKLDERADSCVRAAKNAIAALDEMAKLVKALDPDDPVFHLGIGPL